MVQAVEDMGKLIIQRRHGSAELARRHSQSEMTFFNGVEVPVVDQLKFYESVGFAAYLSPHGRRLDLGESIPELGDLFVTAA